MIWNKYKCLPVQVKASIWYTICSFLQKGISFVVVPLYVRFLTPAEYGQWSVFQSWRDILIIFATLNLYAGVYTKAMVDNAHDRDRYTSSMQGLGTVITLALFALYWMAHDWCNRQIGLSTNYMVLLFLYFIVYPGFAFWTTRQRVEYRYRPMVAVTVLMSVLTPALSIFLLLKTDMRTSALILGYLIIQCSIGLVCYIYQFVKGRCFCHWTYWLRALKFNIPLIPHYLSLIVLNQSDRIMIQRFCGDGDAGVYSFAYQIASAINVLISSINGSRVPWTYENLRNKVYDRLKSITNLLVVLMAVIVLLVSLLAPEVIGLLGTSDYAVAVYVIPVVTLGVFYTFIYDLYASIEFYYGATQFVMVASMIGAVLNIVLNWFFIPIYGFIAASYTTLVCYLLFMVMHYLFSRRVLREQGILVSVYDNRTVFFICGAVSVIGLGIMATYNAPAVRIVLIVLILAVCVVKRNSILSTLKEIRK